MNSSDEITVHAFVDGQLDARDYAAMLDAIARDPELRSRVCEIQRLKQLVRAAWPLPVTTPAAAPSRPAWRRALAASVLVLAAGWAGWETYRQTTGAPDRRVAVETKASAAQQRILFHVASGNAAAVDEMFNDLTFILESSRQAGSPLLVEVIANGDGLNLLRTDTTRHAARIHELARAYPNLHFAACRNTMERLRRDEGVEVRLIPEAEVIESGVAGVAQRQGEGWSYIRV